MYKLYRWKNIGPLSLKYSVQSRRQFLSSEAVTRWVFELLQNQNLFQISQLQLINILKENVKKKHRKWRFWNKMIKTADSEFDFKLYKLTICISVQNLVRNEILNCSRSKKHKSKTVEGGNIYLYKKNWTSKLTGSWVIFI